MQVNHIVVDGLDWIKVDWIKLIGFYGKESGFTFEGQTVRETARKIRKVRLGRLKERLGKARKVGREGGRKRIDYGAFSAEIKFNIYVYFTHRENYDSHKLSQTMPAAKKDTAIFSIGLTDDAVLLAACLTEMK